MPSPKKTTLASLHRAKSQPLKAATEHDWMTQQDLLHIITCGSIDDGKSTLIGRLLWESQQVYDDQITAQQAGSKLNETQGQAMDFAHFVDGLAAEREQGMTIDVDYRFFATPRCKFIVADAPGCEKYTRSMVTCATMADVAVLLVDACQGVLTQTRLYAYLLSLLGIKQVVLAVNKMDLVSYKLEVFHAIVADFHNLARLLGFTSITPIPLAALKGDNISEHSQHTPWYLGPTLKGCLEALCIDRPVQNKAIFSVQWVNQHDASLRGFSGTVVTGQLVVGDQLRVIATGQTAILSRIKTADGDLPNARAGNAITLVLDRKIDASRGDVITLADQPLEMTDQFEATLVWIHDAPGHVSRTYELKLAHQSTSACLTSLKYRINVNTHAHESCKQLALNDIAVANLALSKSLAFTLYEDNCTLGRFILVDKFTHATVALGMIRHNLRRAQNVHRQALNISREDRELINGHTGKVIWFTGLSGSGKSTLANALEQKLYVQGKRTYILDGDNIRQGLNKDLGFTDADRIENIRRVAEVAKLMMDAGLIVITAFISPFRAEREMARELIGEEHFIEVFVDTPLEICELRDPKGLYKKARSGQIPNMTGINSTYEPPLRPACAIVHADQDLDGAVLLLLNLLQLL
jgi:bifunctional enzyme CysN/CysC